MFLRHKKPSDGTPELRIAIRYLLDGKQELTSSDREWETAFVYFERAIDYALQAKKQDQWNNAVLEIVMSAYLGQLEHALTMYHPLSQTKAITITKQAANFYMGIPLTNVSYKFLILSAATTSYHATELARLKLMNLIHDPAIKHSIFLSKQIIDLITEKIRTAAPSSLNESNRKLLAMLYSQQARIAYVLLQPEVVLDYFYHALHTYSTTKSLDHEDCVKIAGIYASLSKSFKHNPCCVLFELADHYFSGSEEVDLIDLKCYAKHYDKNWDMDGRINSLIIQFLQLARSKAPFVSSSTMLKHQLECSIPNEVFTTLLNAHQLLPQHRYPSLIESTNAIQPEKIAETTHTTTLHAPRPRRTLHVNFLKNNKDLPKDNECVRLNKSK